MPAKRAEYCDLWRSLALSASLAVSVTCAQPASAADKARVGLHGSQPVAAPSSTGAAEQPAEPDWSVLNLDATTLNALAEQSTLDSRGSANAAGQTGVDRPATSAFTAKKPLAPGWHTKVGVDSARAASPIRPQDRLLPDASNDQSGAAWANAAIPALDTPVSWDNASFDARFDPVQDQRKLGTKVSKSVPLGDPFSVTLQNGYSVTHQGGAPAAPADVIIPAPVVSGTGPTQVIDTDRTAKFNVLPTGTSFVAGSRMSTADDKWLRTLGAEQKLFGGVNVTGTVSETPTGDLNRSLTAGFKRTW